jgi:hypothetical protein
MNISHDASDIGSQIIPFLSIRLELLIQASVSRRDGLIKATHLAACENTPYDMNNAASKGCSFKQLEELGETVERG